MKTIILAFLFFFHVTIALSAEILEVYELKKSTLVEGPASGQFTKNKATKDALKNSQQIIGLSGVVSEATGTKMLFITDNGFGAKHNSADFLPRLYEIQFKENKAEFTGRYLQFSDKNKKLDFKIQADYQNYYENPNYPHVDFEIRINRLLTGADIDTEAIVVDNSGHIWLAEEFGPSLIETDQAGTVLHPPYNISDIYSPDSPDLLSRIPTTKKSGGFEAMAKTADEKYLLLMLEQTTSIDPENHIRVYQFDILNKKFLEKYYIYHLDQGNMSISDMVAVNNHQFLVLEDNAKLPKILIPNKKIYLIDLNRKLADGSFDKELVCDLQLLFHKEINNEERKAKIDSGYVKSSEEVISIIDKNTLLIANDNNARSHTHFIKIRIDKPLKFIPPNDYSKHLKFNIDKEYSDTSSLFHDNSIIGWTITLLYFALTARLIFITYNANKHSTDNIFWLMMTTFIIFMLLNKQLDLQTDITNYFRQVFREQGWYESRREWQKFFVGSTLIIVFSSLLYVFYFYKYIWIKYKSVLVGFLIIITYVFIRIISFHHIDQYFKKIIFVFKYHQIIELLGITIMMVNIYSRSIINKIGLYSNKFDSKLSKLMIDFDGQEINCPKCIYPMVKLGEDRKKFKCRKCRYVFTTIVERHK